ncbi:MAG: hypothetical protein JO257_30625 [Deltaproteobacteria bacterium]|nr:hypothetical protein [Deltaproteobacteria bacterium]
MKVVAAPIALPVVGVDRIGRFNFIYDDGRPAFEKAKVAAKAKDWAGVKAQCEAALAKDVWHLDAHRLLATALAQQGDAAAAVDHLVTALAGDYYAYEDFAADKDLAAFLATPQGAAVTSVAQQIRDEYGKRIKSGLWVIGRRSPFRWPEKSGVQMAYSRGEVYVFDRETKRYFRITHSDHQVIGFARAGGELSVIGFDKVDHPADGGASSIAHPWLEVRDAELKLVGKRISLPAGKQLAVGYGPGDALVVGVDGVASAVDKTTGKLAKIAGLPVPRVEASLEEGHIVRVPDGVEAAWSGEPPVTSQLKTAAGGTIAVPESGQTAQSSVVVAPGGARIAFSTAVDPCAKDAAPSLYVADAKTGALKHLLTAKSRFDTRWLDATTLAYEDGDGAIRIWDAASGREALRLDERGGLGLDVIALSPAPLCKQAPPTAAGSGSAEEPLPPEEGSAGPVTAPQ